MKFSSPTSSRRIAAFTIAVCLPLVSKAASLPGVDGVPNFFKVNDQVYRGAQPTETGFANLAKLGVKTVIDLRLIGEHSQADEQKIVEAGGMHYVSIPMHGMSTPSDQDVAKVLALFNDKSAQPVFVHCKRGADRTGTVIAAYRIQHDSWQNEKALKEARSLGMSWFEKAMQHYVTRFNPATLAASTGAGEATPAVASDAALAAR